MRGKADARYATGRSRRSDDCFPAERTSSTDHPIQTSDCRVSCREAVGWCSLSRCMNSSGLITWRVVPSAPRGLKLQVHLPGGVQLHPFVGKRRPGDVAAQLLQPPAVMRLDPRRGVQAEAVDVGAQQLYEPYPRAASHLARSASSGRRVARRRCGSDSCGLQRPQRARLAPIGVRLGQIGLAHQPAHPRWS